VLEEAAAETGCPLETAAVMDFGRDSLGLAGPHQSVNASLALGAADRLARGHGWNLPLDERLPAMRRAFLPGRLQWARGEASGADLILDAAHNAHSLAALGDALDDLDIHPAAVVFSCFSDKDLSSLAPHVARLTRGPILVPPIPAACRGRACDPRSIAGALTPRARVADDPEAAVREAARHGSPVLACGSLYLLAALYTQRPHLLAPPTNPAEVRP
jgi:dihydrofolate synthase/folylpolyglutamate synthase